MPTSPQCMSRMASATTSASEPRTRTARLTATLRWPANVRTALGVEVQARLAPASLAWNGVLSGKAAYSGFCDAKKPITPPSTLFRQPALNLLLELRFDD